MDYPEAKIYCGPNLYKYGLHTFQVFYDGLPYNVKAAIQEIPEIELVICDVREIDNMRVKIAMRGTKEAAAFEVLAQSIKP